MSKKPGDTPTAGTGDTSNANDADTVQSSANAAQNQGTQPEAKISSDQKRKREEDNDKSNPEGSSLGIELEDIMKSANKFGGTLNDLTTKAACKRIEERREAREPGGLQEQPAAKRQKTEQGQQQAAGPELSGGGGGLPKPSSTEIPTNRPK